MNETALREALDGALASKDELEAAERAMKEATVAFHRARDRHRKNVEELKPSFAGGGIVIYKGQALRIGVDVTQGDSTIIVTPLRALDAPKPPDVPPPNPLPANAPVPKPPPKPSLSGGTVPPKKGEGGGK